MAFEPKVDWDWFDWDWDWGDSGGGGGGGGGGDGDFVDSIVGGIGTLIGYLAVPVILVVGAFAGLQAIGSAIFGSARPVASVSAPASTAPSNNAVRQGKGAFDVLEEVVPEILEGSGTAGVGPAEEQREADYCTSLIRQAQYAFGDRWVERISPSDAQRCGIYAPRQPNYDQGPRYEASPSYPPSYPPSSSGSYQPRQEQAPASFGSADCRRIIQRAQRSLGSRWRQGVSAQDYSRCSAEIAAERESGMR